MVAAALNHPGLRLTAVELMARRPPLARQRHVPATRRPGAVASRAPGQGMDLREIRSFIEGDDLRRIDAAATARTGQLHVRSFHEDRDDATLLIADFRHGMLWGTGAALRSVRAARWLATLGWIAIGRGGSVGLLAVGDHGPQTLGPKTGEAQMQAIATTLGRAHDIALNARAAAVGLQPALEQAVRLVPPGGEVHLATGPGGLQGTDAGLSRLARGRWVHLHIILDPLEVAPPDLPLTITHDGQSRHGIPRLYDPLPLLAHLVSLGVKARTVLPDDTE